jgi:hypothetical protein
MPESSFHVQRQSNVLCWWGGFCGSGQAFLRRKQPATPANLSSAAGRGELLGLASESNFREEVITIADPGQADNPLRDVAAMYCEDKEHFCVVATGGAVHRLACAAPPCCPEQTVRHMGRLQQTEPWKPWRAPTICCGSQG